MPTTVTRSTPAGETTSSASASTSSLLFQNDSGTTSPISMSWARASSTLTTASSGPVGIRPSRITGRSIVVYRPSFDPRTCTRLESSSGLSSSSATVRGCPSSV